jgi:NAD(P)H-hydrate epimerase
VRAGPSPEDALGDITSEDVARLDAAAAECGVSTLQLMEVAGWQVARCAWQRLGGAAAVSVIAGYGNNGGDGLVAARHLSTWGCGVRVLVLASEARVTGIVAEHVMSARNCGVDVVVDASPTAVQGVIAHSDLIIDAILGTGLHSAPRDPQADAIRAISDSVVPVLSVDVPSGLDASTGEAFEPTVRAAMTCTLTAMKRGLRRRAGPRQAGEIWVADIGMPAVAWRQAGLLQPPGVIGGELVHTSS